jgi:hypothetical protein
MNASTSLFIIYNKLFSLFNTWTESLHALESTESTYLWFSQFFIWNKAEVVLEIACLFIIQSYFSCEQLSAQWNINVYKTKT